MTGLVNKGKSMRRDPRTDPQEGDVLWQANGTRELHIDRDKARGPLCFGALVMKPPVCRICLAEDLVRIAKTIDMPDRGVLVTASVDMRRRRGMCPPCGRWRGQPRRSVVLDRVRQTERLSLYMRQSRSRQLRLV